MPSTSRRKKSAKSDAAAHPIEALREQATALEAAMAVALAGPAKGAVHKLRVLTRRLEAQVMLLTQMEALPTDSQEAKALSRGLRTLRRAAGRVRDLDVQEELLNQQLELPREGAEELGHHLKQLREKRSRKLQQTLEEQVPVVAGALEHLLRSLAESESLTVPQEQLVEAIARWKQQRVLTVGIATGQVTVADMDEEQLHDARKVAKAARYMAESAADSPEAVKAAAEYEAQQNAGGIWHDWADLTASARKFFGKNHALTLAAQQKCDEARTDYLKLLEGVEASAPRV